MSVAGAFGRLPFVDTRSEVMPFDSCSMLAFCPEVHVLCAPSCLRFSAPVCLDMPQWNILFTDLCLPVPGPGMPGAQGMAGSPMGGGGPMMGGGE